MRKLEELKVGDEVVVTESTTKRIAKIERVTKTYLVVDGVRYNRSQGWAWILTKAPLCLLHRTIEIFPQNNKTKVKWKKIK